MSYIINPNPNSRYMRVKPKAQQKALERNGSKIVTLVYKRKDGFIGRYNGVVCDINNGKALMRLMDQGYRTLIMSNIKQIRAQGLIMDY